jgi:hypothetical protein
MFKTKEKEEAGSEQRDKDLNFEPKHPFVFANSSATALKVTILSGVCA